jgi:methylmalonyl-CoA/ethylmalonyl-CoA epimerase
MPAAGSALALRKIGQIAVRVRDLERAVAFYRDVLGMKFLFQIPNLAFFDCGGVRIMLDVITNPEFDHPASIIYYRVADIQGATAALAAHDVEIEIAPHVIAKMEDHELWMAFFRDPDRNMLALMSEVPAA